MMRRTRQTAMQRFIEKVTSVLCKRRDKSHLHRREAQSASDEKTVLQEHPVTNDSSMQLEDGARVDGAALQTRVRGLSKQKLIIELPPLDAHAATASVSANPTPTTTVPHAASQLPIPIEVFGSVADSGLGLCSDIDPEESCTTCSWEEEEEEEEEEGQEIGAAHWPLEDWLISIGEISLDKVVAKSPVETVYSGYWHGSVTVHTKLSTVQNPEETLMAEVSTLTHIRHENIQLFLGVCLDLHTDYVTVVMDQPKGQSLHTLLHKQGHQFTFQAITKMMNQIAQGLDYLHAKGISHPLLTSKSTMIHYRVCISMLSPSALSGDFESDDLIYLPPEDMRGVCEESANSRVLRTTTSCQQPTTNIFSFGTLVYEMVTMERPFSNVPGNALIWQVSTGRTQSLRHLQQGKFKEVITHCWRTNPKKRPSFRHLLDTIEQNMSPRACGLKSHFSFSEPSRLAKLGL